MSDFILIKEVKSDCVKIVLKQANYLLEFEGRMKRQKYFIIELFFVNPYAFAFAKKSLFIKKQNGVKIWQKEN